MPKRVCLDCPALVASGPRCAACERRRDAARGRRQERGYGAGHDADRQRWSPLVEAGQVHCRRYSNGTCLEPDPTILPGSSWHLGHPDAGCTAPTAPEHRHCNIATARADRR